MSLNPALMSSKRSNWETSNVLYERVNAIIPFVLDAAASAANTKCPRYFDEINSALDPHRRWGPGPVWLNPPYGRGIIDRWISRAQYES